MTHCFIKDWSVELRAETGLFNFQVEKKNSVFICSIPLSFTLLFKAKNNGFHLSVACKTPDRKIKAE